jgi:hypothetical protein
MLLEVDGGRQMKVWSTALAAAVFSLLSGCAHDYLYVPVVPGVGGGPAVRYPIPPGAPRGEAYVTSFGYTDIDADPGLPGTLLHARLAVSNGSNVPWTVDGRTQSLMAPGRPPQGAAFLNSDAGTGPVYQIPPSQARVFDMYFAMPPPLDQAPNLASFQLDWNINAGGQPVDGRTSFQRLEGSGGSYDPYPPYVRVGLGFGVGWWYGPFFPYHRAYPPIIRRYYFPPARAPAGSGRGVPPGQGAGGLRGSPPTGGAWRGTPPASSTGGVWRGTPPGGRSVRAAPPSGGMRGTPSRGGGRGGGR